MFRHPRSRKIPDFDQNYHFTIFQKIRIFSGFTPHLSILAIPDNETKTHMLFCFKRALEWIKRAQPDFPMQELITVPDSPQNEVFRLQTSNQTKRSPNTYIASIDMDHG